MTPTAIKAGKLLARRLAGESTELMNYDNVRHTHTKSEADNFPPSFHSLFLCGFLSRFALCYNLRQIITISGVLWLESLIYRHILLYLHPLFRMSRGINIPGFSKMSSFFIFLFILTFNSSASLDGRFTIVMSIFIFTWGQGGFLRLIYLFDIVFKSNKYINIFLWYCWAPAMVLKYKAKAVITPQHMTAFRPE